MSAVTVEEKTTVERDTRWQAVVTRDAAADGAFVYAVRTTGIYCRPSCPSRRPKPCNVRLYATATDAIAEGYRACRRCNPDAASRAEFIAEIVAHACRAIENAEEIPMLGELASAAGMSPFYFHRQFKAVTGLTPRAYALAERTKRLHAGLNDAKASVTDAIYGAGFNSTSRFYEKSNQVLGMTPTAFKRGGKDAEIRFAVGECSLGAILVACSGKGICAITLGDNPDGLVRELQDRFPKARLIGGDRDFEQLVARVIGFVEAPRSGLDLPLDLRGSAFEKRVWRALQKVPTGQTVSYSEVAQRIGEPTAVRAVAQACAANKIAVAIPCHRVVRSDGALSGYRWGVERKRALIKKEAQT
jgi:AraC family transcriptional regulator of adaptative response/methylated-DNA-[protein]-cysteine methyltransferase